MVLTPGGGVLSTHGIIREPIRYQYVQIGGRANAVSGGLGARCIAAGNKRVTVITNAVQLSCEVVKNEFCGAILLGGALTRGEPLTSGAIASSDLMHFHANKIILGAAGVSLRYGVTPSRNRVSSSSIRLYTAAAIARFWAAWVTSRL